MVARLVCNEKAAGSNPAISIIALRFVIFFMSGTTDTVLGELSCVAGRIYSGGPAPGASSLLQYDNKSPFLLLIILQDVDYDYLLL